MPRRQSSNETVIAVPVNDESSPPRKKRQPSEASIAALKRVNEQRRKAKEEPPKEEIPLEPTKTPEEPKEQGTNEREPENDDELERRLEAKIMGILQKHQASTPAPAAAREPSPLKAPKKSKAPVKKSKKVQIVEEQSEDDGDYDSEDHQTPVVRKRAPVSAQQAAGGSYAAGRGDPRHEAGNQQQQPPRKPSAYDAYYRMIFTR